MEKNYRKICLFTTLQIINIKTVILNSYNNAHFIIINEHTYLGLNKHKVTI